jgi:hypothetical protein
MQNDLTRSVAELVAALPRRMEAETVSEFTVGEVMDLFCIDDMMKRPDVQAKISELREKLCITLARLLREKNKTEFESFETGLHSCERCHAIPILAMVVQEGDPVVVLFRCPYCRYETRQRMLDEELIELKAEGIPLDPLGRPVAKREGKRGKPNKKRSPKEDGNV